MKVSMYNDNVPSINWKIVNNQNTVIDKDI